MSPFTAPMVMPIPVLAKTLMIAISVPFPIEVDWSSFIVAIGGERLSVTEEQLQGVPTSWSSATWTSWSSSKNKLQWTTSSSHCRLVTTSSSRCAMR
uniref:Secreted protein n=1 Tax=Nelumbo nucifera TaxID=4432 RepID=A0A822Z3N2_NELNU|nr:TPA_asm: hypothetical protein HUJ06_006768 [Nelumbo nucifera]